MENEFFPLRGGGIYKKSLRLIFESFLLKKSSSLLIKGNPGTGKTTLALELLNIFEKFIGFYISTRVSISRLKQQFPWIKNLMKKENFLTFHEINKGIIAEDLRLSEPSVILEKILKMVTKKPAACVILDSWDALAKEIEYKERLKLEKAIVSVADANDSFVIFISEEPEFSTVSYLVDGIINLENKIINGINLRKMTIEKLRGVQISESTFYFSLIDSHFMIIPKFYNLFFKSYSKFESIPSQNGFISSGNKDLNYILGGFKKGSIVLLELGINLNRKLLAIFLACIVLNHLVNKKPAIVINTSDKPYTSVIKYLKPFCENNNLKNLTIITFDDVKDFSFNSVKLTNGSEKNYNIILETYKKIKEKYKESIILTYDIGWDEISYYAELKTIISKWVNFSKLIRNNGDVLILINRTSFKTIDFCKTIADLHIKMWEDEGTPFIQIVQPHLGIYGIVADLNKNYPNYYLLKVV